MPKKIINLLLILIITVLFTLILPFLNPLYFFISVLIFLFIAGNLIWNILPLKIKDLFDNRRRFTSIFLFLVIFFLSATVTVKHTLSSQISYQLNLAINLILLFFSIFLSWLIANFNKKVFLTGLSVFILITFLTLIFFQNVEKTKNITSSSDRIKTLPYISWAPAEDLGKRGVSKYNKKLSYKGYNLFNYVDGDAYLVNMSGEVVYKWDDLPFKWHYIHMMEDGELLGIKENGRLFKVDRNSNIKWVRKGVFHHDIYVDKNKNIYTIAMNNLNITNRIIPLPILNDNILILSQNGRLKKRISLFNILKDKISAEKYFKIYLWFIKNRVSFNEIQKLIGSKLFNRRYKVEFYDIFHTNTVEIVNKNIKGVCKKGDLLICIRNMNLVGIIDLEEEKMIWSWGKENLDYPHHPTMLENGNILIFDNGYHRNYSRVIELNLKTKKIIWSYKTNPSDDFYTKTRGWNQRLPNGNTLITESNKGRVFEVTIDGKIVWEFYAPKIKEKDEKRRAIYKMKRITNPQKLPFHNP